MTVQVWRSSNSERLLQLPGHRMGEGDDLCLHRCLVAGEHAGDHQFLAAEVDVQLGSGGLIPRLFAETVDLLDVGEDDLRVIVGFVTARELDGYLSENSAVAGLGLSRDLVVAPAVVRVDHTGSDRATEGSGHIAGGDDGAWSDWAGCCSCARCRCAVADRRCCRNSCRGRRRTPGGGGRRATATRTGTENGTKSENGKGPSHAGDYKPRRQEVVDRATSSREAAEKARKVFG